MARRLPSLNALKAFEASARHESFTDAATELFVTHAAISRHIRELEETLGTELFTRTGRGVELTEAGRALVNASPPCSTNWPMPPVKPQLWVPPALCAYLWSPPLPPAGWWADFRNSTTSTPILNSPSTARIALVDFYADDVDIGIRYGNGVWDDTEAGKLSDVVIFPVCAPKLIADEPKLTPEGLGEYTLLHENRKQWWIDWLAAAGVKAEMDWRGTIFQNHLAIEAAEAGAGFALGDQILCTDALVEGWLVRPFAVDMKDHGGYWIVRKKGSKETAVVKAFREWLLSELVDTNKRFQGMKGKIANP